MTIWQKKLAKHIRSDRADTPRYIALANAIDSAIGEGELTAGARLPTHRSLADTLHVTVGTITRGYAEAERRGLVEARVGSGTFVRNRLNRDNKFAILRHKPSGLIDFSLNLPIPSEANRMFAEVLQDLADDLRGDIGCDVTGERDFLSYQPEQGSFVHRQWAAQWLSSFGLNHCPDQITVTCGGQHGIMLALMATTRTGDVILSEGLTYPGMNAIASQLGVKVIGLPMDEEGIIPAAMDEQCKANVVRALYCTPTIQNPTNATMSLPRRQAILEVARRHQIWVIEDEVSSNFLQDRLPPLAALDPERCIYINSHSKTVAAGLRVGYLATPKKIVDSVAAAIQAQCWFAPPVTAEIAQRWMQRRDTPAWFAWHADELQRRQALAQDILGEFDCHIIPSSFHAWLTLPEPWRAAEFSALLRDKGVMVLAAESFAVGRFPAPQAIRISISAPSCYEDVERGLTIVRDLLLEGTSVRMAAL